jgi:hypothetical protein
MRQSGGRRRVLALVGTPRADGEGDDADEDHAGDEEAGDGERPA